MFIIYIADATGMDRGERAPYIWTGGIIWLAVIFTDTWETVSVLKAGTLAGGLENYGIDAFLIGYLGFVVLAAVLFAKVRDRLFRRVLMGFYGTIGISLIMLIMQAASNESSFTVATFLYPVIAMFYIMHSNPYDAKSGSLDIRSFEDMIRTCCERKQEFLFMSLYLRGMAEGGITSSEEVNALLRKYCVVAFKSATLFEVDKNQMIMIVPH